jgi:DNA-binding GntR family transcriptional regulator
MPIARGESNAPRRSLSKMNFEQPSTAEHVAAALRDLILQGDLAPGEAIEEQACVESFGISRNTAREAIRELARGGLVTQARRRPAVVTRLTAADVADIFRTRRVVELGAVDEAIASPDIDFSTLEDTIREMELLGGTQEWRRLGDADHAFHAAIVGLPDSARLSRTYETLQAEVRLCLSLTDRWDTDPKDQVRQHREIADLLLAGEGEKCKALLAAHIDDAEMRVLEVIGSSDAEEASVGPDEEGVKHV